MYARSMIKPLCFVTSIGVRACFSFVCGLYGVQEDEDDEDEKPAAAATPKDARERTRFQSF
jgi:hypothetical protein